MATVQSLMLNLVQKIDPYTKDGTVEFAAGTVGTVAGSAFTAQRQLDIYNEARIALVRSLLNVMPKDEVTLAVGGTVVDTTLTFSTQAATKPTAMISFISMETAAGVPMILLPSTYMAPTYAANNAHLTSTATVLNIFDIGTQYKFIGTAALVPNAATYKIQYIGLTNWALSDVTGGTSTETIDLEYHPILMELAAAIASEAGNVEVGQLAAKLLGGK